jgi:3-dehydroquinate dehydratase-2
MHILVLHGPNLNMLGRREPAIYGHTTLAEINAALQAAAAAAGATLTAAQSNHEGQLVDTIQEHWGRIDGVIINPGALTHYGLSLRDALAMLAVPIIEVHLSNVHAREPYRHHSYLSPACAGIVVGFGVSGYALAIDGLARTAKPRADARR